MSIKKSRQHYPVASKVWSFLLFWEIICQRVSIPTKVIEFLSTWGDTWVSREEAVNWSPWWWWEASCDQSEALGGDQSEALCGDQWEACWTEIISWWYLDHRWSLLITHHAVWRQIEIDHCLTFLLRLWLRDLRDGCWRREHDGWQESCGINKVLTPTNLVKYRISVHMKDKFF